MAEEAGRAAAEVDRIHLVAHGSLGRLPDMGQHRLEVEVHGLPVHAAAQGVEVAVFAFAPAEGNMDVNPQGLPGVLERFFLVSHGYLPNLEIASSKAPLEGRWRARRA